MNDKFFSDYLKGYFDEAFRKLAQNLWLDIMEQCECGKEKHGFTSHTNWCPRKFEDDHYRSK